MNFETYLTVIRQAMASWPNNMSTFLNTCCILLIPMSVALKWWSLLIRGQKTSTKPRSQAAIFYFYFFWESIYHFIIAACTLVLIDDSGNRIKCIWGGNDGGWSENSSRGRAVESTLHLLFLFVAAARLYCQIDSSLETVTVSQSFLFVIPSKRLQIIITKEPETKCAYFLLVYVTGFFKNAFFTLRCHGTIGYIASAVILVTR